MKIGTETRTRSRESKGLESGSGQIWFAWTVTAGWTEKVPGKVIVELSIYSTRLGSRSGRGDKPKYRCDRCNWRLYTRAYQMRFTERLLSMESFIACAKVLEPNTSDLLSCLDNDLASKTLGDRWSDGSNGVPLAEENADDGHCT